MKSKAEILKEFCLFSMPTGGIGSWLTDQTHSDVFERLGRIDEEPLSAVQLNQLLVMGHEAPVGDGFYRYYWLQAPSDHPYNVRDIPGFSEAWLQSTEMIASLGQLKWGMYRLYVDALLYFGNVRTAFRRLRDLSIAEITGLLSSERFDTEAIKRRGPPLPLRTIAKDSRYLISEMACKSYGDLGETGDLRAVLIEGYKAHTNTNTNTFERSLSLSEEQFTHTERSELPLETPLRRFGNSLRIESQQVCRLVSQSSYSLQTKFSMRGSHPNQTSRRNMGL